MKLLTADEILELWDTTAGTPTLEKSLRLLAKACSAENIAEIARLSIGDRDVRLLQIREWLFGNILRNKANCPKCAETIEWESNTDALHLQSFPQDLSVKDFQLKKNGYTVQFRSLNSLDLLKVMSAELNENSYRKVISECILSVKKNNEDCSINDLPDFVWEALNDRMSKEDPQAEINMQLICPNCNYCWEMYFDIATYLWLEINTWVKKILEEVYWLARAFSWSEKQILGMSAHRRRLYLEMIHK